MALTITQPGQAKTVDTLRITIYGEPGVGKSSFGFTCKKPLLLDFDNGSYRSDFEQQGTRINIDSWDDIADLMRNRGDILAAHDTIVIDTVSTCLDYLGAHLIKLNYKNGNGRGGLSQLGYGALAVDFRGWISQLRLMGKSIIMIAQHVDKQEGDGTKKRPKAQGQSAAFVIEMSDYVGFAHIAGGHRVIGFKPTDDYYAKGQRGIELVQVPDYNTRRDFGAVLMADMLSQLNRSSERNAEAAAAVADWEATIQSWTSAADFQKAITVVLALPQGIKEQVLAIVKKRREALGVSYDASTKTFIDPQAPTEPTPQPTPEVPTTPAPVAAAAEATQAAVEF